MNNKINRGQTPIIGLLIVGAEILSGKRQDKHLPKVIELLSERGLRLAWAQVLGDDEAMIAEAIRAAHARGDVMLSCGGIGATPDDKTRQAAARALGVPIVRHAEAEALILQRYAETARPNRVLMADFPQSATLIPNPVNQVAGFSVGHLHFVPGFPEMAWPMIEWVLDTHYAAHHHQICTAEYLLRVMGTAGEGDLLHLMEGVLEAYPSLEFSSLPCRGDAQRARHIEFGFKGSPEIAAQAYQWFWEHLHREAGVVVEAIRPPA